MDTYADAINAARKAARIALTRSAKTTGQSQDDDLNIYQKLTPEAFNVLVATYGADSVAKYIRHMEVKRIKTGV
jgi:hypothetical protein